MEKYYSNLNCYNENGNRLSIFGRHIDNNTLEIYIITCSKKDNFSRKFAKNVYEEYLKEKEGKLSRYKFYVIHPIIYNINIENTNKPKWSFLSFCREQFYKIREEYFYVSGNITSIDIGKYGGKLIGKTRNITVKYLK